MKFGIFFRATAFAGLSLLPSVIQGDRELDIDFNKDSVVVESENKDTGFKDEIEFRLKGENTGPRLSLKYKFKDKLNKESTEFDFRLFEIIEFEPTNVTLGYQESVDTVVQTYGSSAWQFSDIVAETRNISNKSVETFTLSSEDGVVSMIVYFVSEVVDKLSPDQVKFDIELGNFPYLQNNTALAYRARLQSQSKFKEFSDSDDDETDDEGEDTDDEDDDTTDDEDDDTDDEEELDIDFGDEEVSGAFRYVTHVTTQNGTKVEIIRTSGSGDNETGKTAYFTLATINNISNSLWDPALGVDYQSPNSASSTVVPFFASALFAVGLQYVL